LLIAAVLTTMAGTALVAARLLETVSHPPRSAVLVPTGINILTPDTGSYARTVADGDGVLWARGYDGRLVRFDPATGSGQTWTTGDDAAFAATDITPARQGGVWLVGKRTLRWFDGALFRDVIDAPTDIATAVEAPDASLWVATDEAAILRWDGTSWNQLDAVPGRPDEHVAVPAIDAIAVDSAGRPWIGFGTSEPWPTGTGWVWRYNGSAWVAFDATDAAPLGYPVSTITQLPGGAVLVATAGGLARFEGSTWTDMTGWPSVARHTASVAAGPDGSIWVDVDGDPASASDEVWRFDGHSWVPSGYLPVAAAGSVVPTNDGVYVGNTAGIFRLSDGQWTQAWPPAPSPMARSVWPMLALSRDELWAHAEAGLWHFLHGAWTREATDAGRVNAMTAAPDGTLWVAGERGVAYRRDGHWTFADAGAANVIAVDQVGTVWVAGTAPADASGNAACEVWTLRFEWNAWARRPVTGCPLNSAVKSLAIDAGGALFAGSSPAFSFPFWSGFISGGLARFDGHHWETIHDLGGAAIVGAAVLGTAPNGDVWVASQTATTGQVLARFDGKAWTVVEEPEDALTRPVLAPDGTLWASAGTRGPAPYDGQQWTFPYAGIVSGYVGVAAVAPDGTVFCDGGVAILRFPARATHP
jgi:hypothetical protein